MYFMGMYLVEVFARPLVGAYSDKIGKRKWVIIAECLLCAVLLVALTVVKAKLLLLFIIFGIGFLAGSIPVVGQAYAIDMIPDEQILEILCSDNDIPPKAEQLIEAAKDAGGIDNITVVLASII